MQTNVPGGGTTVLVVEDDRQMAETLRETLQSSGYRVWQVENGADARSLLEQARPDLILLDLMLPDVDGLVLCSQLKTMVDAPIIICSGSTHQRDRILGLKLGADDYIGKPFDIYELEARIEAVLRRARPAPRGRAEGSQTADQIHVGALTIDRARRRVTVGDTLLQLTPTEYRLLTTLASRPDAIISRNELAQRVWGYEDASNGRTIDVHVRRLRVKLNGSPVPAPAIISVRGFGYKLSSEETTALASADEQESQQLSAVRQA